VGAYEADNIRFTLILHWNGTKWAQVASPTPSSFSMLSAVAASSATNAWAVGQFNDDNSGLDQNFAIHCCD
jgi:hypothetical protein